MMLYPFTPLQNQNFQFQPTFDGTQYNIVITWNFWGQRYYVNIYTLNGGLVLSIPMIASPDDYSISLTAGYFTSTLVFRDSTQTFEVS